MEESARNNVDKHILPYIEGKLNRKLLTAADNGQFKVRDLRDVLKEPFRGDAPAMDSMGDYGMQKLASSLSRESGCTMSNRPMKEFSKEFSKRSTMQPLVLR